MSHQVIITFDLDENRIQENAEKEAGRQIARDVIDEAFGSSYSRHAKMTEFVSKAVRDIIEEERDRIITEAISELVKSLARSKVVREKVQEEFA